MGLCLLATTTLLSGNLTGHFSALMLFYGNRGFTGRRHRQRRKPSSTIARLLLGCCCFYCVAEPATQGICTYRKMICDEWKNSNYFEVSESQSAEQGSPPLLAQILRSLMACGDYRNLDKHHVFLILDPNNRRDLVKLSN